MKLAILLAVAGTALSLASGPAGSAPAAAAVESCHAGCFQRCQALYPDDPYLISSCTDGCVLTECGGEPWP